MPPAVVNPTQTPTFLASRYGLVDGAAATLITVLGRRLSGWSSTTLYGDVCSYLDTSQAEINPVVLGTTYYIRSSSASDTNTAPAGTGARQVRVVYLDSSGAQQVMTVSLNGTTAVSLGNAISYFQWAEVASTGSNLYPVGNITISSVTGAPTVAQIVEFIQAGYNRSRSGRYKVPTGKVFYGLGWDVSAIGQTQDSVIRGTVFADDRSLSTVFHSQDGLFVPGNTQSPNIDLHYLPFPAGCEIKGSSIPGAAAAGNRCDLMFHGILTTV